MVKKLDFAKRWIVFAKEDLKVSKLALKEGIYNAACFHAQQAVEKIFKSLFVKNGKTVPKVHSLEKLRTDLGKVNAVWNNFEKETRLLDKFYVPTRYPDALPGSLPDGLPNNKDARLAVDAAEEIFKAAKNKSE